MDDTQGLDATASRKRRSSILKSQRAPRTPLTELELNVATPPDTTKSRRVSFSRRTGVAEFITDEATNTWKTIYVEQNKSMESSLNDSAKNPPKQTVGHLGKRIFEQQFQEEEFYNFGSIITSNIPAQELNMSLRGNLTQQFAALERDLDEKNLAVPQTNFELSSLTDHKSKIFVDDVTNPTLGEMSNKININFSSLEPVGAAQDKCYDLDEIEKDLLIPRSNACNPFGTINVSEQIEFDINTKPVALKSDEFDMSITDTVRNPQVEEVLHNFKSTKNDTISNMDNDWTLDKENIVMNPYVAPKESINFAINEVPDQVLVFDGKRLTIQSEHKNPFNQSREENNFNKTLLPKEISERPPQRKTIVLNLNDDLPNFIDVPAAPGVSTAGKNITMHHEHQKRHNEIDFSILDLMPNRTDLSNSQTKPDSKTIIYDSGDIANISVTQAIVTNILIEKEKRKTIVFGNDTGELSMTQALPSNVLAASKIASQNKTVLYDVDNISITQAVPMNLLLQNKSVDTSKYVATAQSDFDLSFTQAVPHNMLISNKSNESNKRNTIVFDNEKADISITRALPSNILLSDNTKDNKSNSNKSIHRDVRNILDNVRDTLDKESILKSKTLDDKKESKDNCNMSQTEMLSLNIIANDDTESNETQHAGSDRLSSKSDQYINIPIQVVTNDTLLVKPEMEAQTFVNDCDISVTQAVPSNIIIEQKEMLSTHEPIEAVPYVINTIDSANNLKNIAISEQISRKSLCQYSDTHLSDSNVKVSTDELPQETIMGAEDSMSMTHVLQLSDISRKIVSKRGTIVFDNDEIGDISVTRPIPTNILLNEIKSNNDNTLLIFENVNSVPLSSVSESEGMLTKSEENMPAIMNTSNHVDIPVQIEPTLSTTNIVYDTHINNKSLSCRTLQQAKEELQNSVAECHNLHKDISIENIQDDHTKTLSEHDEILLKSMNYIDCVDQKLETHSLKSVTEHKHKDVFVYQAVTTHNVSKHQGLRTEQGDLKGDRAMNIYEENTSRKSNAGKQSEVSLLIHDVSHYIDETKTQDGTPSTQNQKTSILAELLNMSGESLNVSVDRMDDKNVMVGLESVLALEKLAQDTVTDIPKIEQANSIELTSEEPKTTSALKEDVSKQPIYNADPKEVRSCTIQAEDIHRPQVSLGCENESKIGNENDLQSEEMIISSNSDTKTHENNIEGLENKIDAGDKYSIEADDTKELLEMLTDFTDKTMPVQLEVDVSNSSKELVDVSIDMQDKTDAKTSDSKESYDKLQNEIEAQPTQEAMTDVESENTSTCYNNETEEETDEVIYKEVNLRRKSGHVSRDVVKTLQFDESNDEVNCNSNSTPLKKTAPVDISTSKDSKAKVIPTFLNDVPDGLKSLMQDLVKPSADLIPFCVPGVDMINGKHTTTVNKHLQTNLITSSQIDIDINSYPASESNIIMARRHKHEVEPTATDVATSVDSVVDCHVDSEDIPKQDLIFDHKNPLNNVILCPSGKTNIHRYSPKKSAQPKPLVSPDKNNLKVSPRTAFLEDKFKEAMNIQRVSTLYNIDINDKRMGGHSDEPCYKTGGRVTFTGTQKALPPIKTVEVNTSIAMKCNKDLLQASSSLTLVEEETINRSKNKSPIKSQKASPVKVIFKLNNTEDDNVESICKFSNADSTRAQKRNYHHAKYDQYGMCAVNVTPKPLSKIQKLSSSPRHVEKYKMEANKSINRPFRNEPPKRCSKNLLNNTKPKVGTTTIIHHFAVCKLNEEDKEKLVLPVDDLELSSASTLKTETISRKDLKDCTSSELTSFTSSNAMKEMEYSPSFVTVSRSQETVGTRSDRSDTGCSDVMSQIESLSFMGSRECECEGCEQDAWRFLLLRRRLRLTVRVARDLADLPAPAPPAPAEPPTRPDAPLISITIEPVHQETDAVWCASVRLACEAMRYECVRCGGSGRGVAALLCRCVGVARAAARWACLMTEARAHLAFTLAHCGKILLNVANFHIRRVYQVTLRIELVVEDARELAWPRACHVTVRDVTAGPRRAVVTPAGDDGPPPAPRLRRALRRVPHDWGHVPRTVWKIFRYLNHKTEEDELILPLHSRQSFAT